MVNIIKERKQCFPKLKLGGLMVTDTRSWIHLLAKNILLKNKCQKLIQIECKLFMYFIFHNI